jgi:signal transduction histidine kinase/DNA-binding response OmpR family regulator
MKLNVRLILISFVVVVVISVASMLIFYSIAGSLISKQQNQTILNAANDFAFVFQNTIQTSEEDFIKISDELDNIKKISLDSTNLDFVFTLVGDSTINYNEFSSKNNGIINTQSKSFRQFFKNNPNVILQYKKIKDEKNVFYGILITPTLLDSLARNIHCEVALLVNDAPFEISNSLKTQSSLLSIVKAEQYLKLKNNFDLYREELENSDFIASYYSLKQFLTPGGRINFILFSSFTESAELRIVLKNIAIIIIIAGGALSFIFVLLFTTKIRKQISLLSESVEITREGDLNHRVPIIVKDELGQLGSAFNNMLDEIKRNKEAEKEYAEFIALINRNPSLAEISEAALSKIVETTGLTFGVLYSVVDKSIIFVSTYGIGKNSVLPEREADFYNNAIVKHEVVEFEFKENFPEIKTGLAQIKLKYMIVYPIVYNRETIAILELASESVPQTKVKKYLENIHDQLAIGLVNARSLKQLENLVRELQILNDEYQKQNQQIVEQNQRQKELHHQLEEKAAELEMQRAKAVELTQVKSQFLASMSHELRTPLISILGLTELMAKDPAMNSKIKDRINIVYRNGKKLLGMITNILEFSKFDSGKIELRKESFLLDELIDEILPGVVLLSEEKKLKFELVKEPNANLVVNTDKTKLEHVLNNLLVNAIKFTEKGKVILKIEAHKNNNLEFRVYDTGVGIPENEIESVFAEFQQLNGGTVKKFGGVGLGLAICKKYVELMGSELRLESKLNSGSCFFFVLEDVVLDVFETDEEIISAPQRHNMRNSKKNILLITDNSDTEKLLADYFTEKNIFVSWAPSYGIAYELIQTNEFDLIIASQIENNEMWNFINSVESNSDLRRPKIIITPVIREDKIGQNYFVDKYLSKDSVPKKIIDVLRNIENISNISISEVEIVSADENESVPLNKILENEYSTEIFNTPADFFRRIETEVPDLVIVDVESVKNDSIEIINRVKNNSAIKNVPLIFIMPGTVSVELSNQLNLELIAVTKKTGNNILSVVKETMNHMSIEIITEKELTEKIDEQTAEVETSFKKNIGTSKTRPTILIVDDDGDSLFTIGEFIKEMGYETIYAHNGMECLVTLNHIQPDLVLLDIMMPQMDGFETIKRIRSDKKLSKLPVLALTAYAMLENKNVIEKSGFDDLITKPVNSKILAAKIEERIKGR